MKPRDIGGVVDPNLNVYGMQNLKVAGMSILHRETVDSLSVDVRA